MGNLLQNQRLQLNNKAEVSQKGGASAFTYH